MIDPDTSSDGPLLLELTTPRLIVSCQAYPGDPMNDPDIMVKVALSAQSGGARAVRAQGLAEIQAMNEALNIPIVGIWKDGDADVFITPTVSHALAVLDAGATIVAVDGTRRRRPDGLSLRQTISALREQRGENVEVMADCGSLEDALEAEEAGATYLATTLSGYSGDRPITPGPDLELIRSLRAHTSLPVVAEGRIRTPSDLIATFEAGADAACVGSAITHPRRTTEWFLAEASRM